MQIKKLVSDIKNKSSHTLDFLLQNDIESTLSKSGIKIRKVFSPVLRKIYSTQTEYTLVKENVPKQACIKKGKIFIINHRQADDIVLGVNAVGESGYVVFGNKYLALDTINGWGLWGHGVILLDRNDPRSRKSTYEKMKYVLNNNGNIYVYAEGYWNLDDDGLADDRHLADDHKSENWLVQDLNIGPIRLAKETGCPIIPTILHYDELRGKKCYSKKGQPFYVEPNDDIFEKKDELLEIMTTTYYELMEKYSFYTNEYLRENNIDLREYWHQLKKELVAACDIPRINYKLDLKNEKLIGKAKVLKGVVPRKVGYKGIKGYDE